MNLIFLPKYGPKAASCRYRFLQYIPYLEEHGIHCTVSPLFDDRYLEHKFDTGQARVSDVLQGIFGRTRAVLTAGRYDAVVLQYEAFPYLPAFFERYLAARKVAYLYDLDDAIFHQYDQSRSAVLRRLLSGKIRRVISGASLIMAGSDYLARYARRINPRVEVLPTVIDLSRYPPRPPAAPDSGRPFTIGWIGSPSTAAYLPGIAPALRAFCAECNARVILIGSGPVYLDGVPVEFRPWDEATEAAQIGEFDVGIMPLPDTPWARGKCGFKLIQYMASGLPVIASPVGANLSIVDDGVNGLLAQGESEWLSALRDLRDDPDLRQRLGHAGRATVADHYSLQVTAPRLLSLVQRSVAVA